MALYFPKVSVSPKSCLDAGETLRNAYFEGTGILLSRDARDQYFLLLTALTKAAAATSLAVPETRADYTDWISEAKLNQYRLALKLGEPTIGDIDDWRFGAPTPNDGGAEPAVRFRDFVLLQKLASALRTALADQRSS